MQKNICKTAFDRCFALAVGHALVRFCQWKNEHQVRHCRLKGLMPRDTVWRKRDAGRERCKQYFKLWFRRV